MYTNINLSEKSEATLKKVKALGAINNIDTDSKEKQINQVLEWFDGLVTLLDDETLEQTINLKKTF